MAYTSDRPYKCTQCFATFTRSASLKCHLRIHSDENSEQFSDDGGDTLDPPSNLKAPPNRLKLPVNSIETPPSNLEYPSNKKKEQSVLPTGEKPHKCPHCSAAFRAADNLERHLRTHTGEKPYKCLYCSRTFDMLIGLRRHQCTHSGKTPYKCAQCNSTFMHAHALKEHLEVHTGRKPEKCMYCHAIFYEIRTLTQHLKTHTDDKFKKCVYCNGVFHNTHTLKEHLRTHTGEQLYKCTHCFLRFPDKDLLKAHLQTHVDECQKEVHRCTHCNARFAHLRTLKVHLRMHTGEESNRSSAGSADTNKRIALHTSENPKKFTRYHYDAASSPSNNLEKALGTRSVNDSSKPLTLDYDVAQLDPEADPLRLPMVKCEIPDEDLDYAFSTSCSGDYLLMNQDIKIEVKEESLDLGEEMGFSF